jgi:hypothetical protein
MLKMNKFLFREYSQCKERFWFRINEAESEFEITPPDAMQEFFTEQKKLIEKYAFELLSKKNTINCELQKEIKTDDFSVKIDICAQHLKSGKTDIYELYNSRGFKTHRLWDLAFLTLALIDAGYSPGKVFAVTINPEYVRAEDDIIPEHLLQIIDLSQKVNRLLPKVKLKLKEAFEFAQKKKFEIYPEGHHCTSKDCLALRHFQPDYSPNIAEVEIANDAPLLPRIKTAALNNWLDKLKYPIYFLDYEAVTSNIPVYPHSKPFQHIVFQYSLHKMDEQGNVEHFEFIPDSKVYPVLNLIKSLHSNLETDMGSILVWHDSFEKARNREMAARFPEYGDFFYDVNSRIVDMEKVFNQDGGYYLHPEFYGKSSLKKVFPVLLPDEPAYDLLDVGDGMMASILWHRYLTDNLGENYSPELLRKQLSEYCGLDTEAMVKILKFLLSLELKAVEVDEGF